MKKRLRGKLPLLLGVLAACLVLTAGAGLFLRQAWLSRHGILSLFSSAFSPTPTQEIPQPVLPIPTAHDPLVISSRETSEDSKSAHYSIQAKWPALEWGDDPRVNGFNQAAEKIVKAEIDGFKEEIIQIPDDPAFNESGSSLAISFSTPNTNNGIISVLMRVSIYIAGAAHPGTHSQVINYNLRDGKELTLEDLFLPNTKFLEPISTICVEDLKNRGVLSWEDGALPKAENYRVWNVTPDGLLITFDEYQVAPYAAGPQSVIIPYEKLKDIIQMEGPLAVFLHSDR